jgi:hypothetical protein
MHFYSTYVGGGGKIQIHARADTVARQKIKDVPSNKKWNSGKTTIENCLQKRDKLKY